MSRAQRIRTQKDAEAIDRAVEEQVRPMRGWESFVRAARATALTEYPLDREAIDYAFGDIELEAGKGDYIPVRDLSERLPAGSFKDSEELIRAMRALLDRAPSRRGAA